MAIRTEKCPCGLTTHPKATMDERQQLHDRLYAALHAIGEAWGVANTTPAFHDLTERIQEASNTLSAIKRVV